MPFDIPSTKSLSDIFQVLNTFFVPDYQRAYEWRKNHVVDFFKDTVKILECIRTAGEKDKHNLFHYGGTLILRFDCHHYEIIDGQQRMTTAFIFVHVLKILCEKYGFFKWLKKRKKKKSETYKDIKDLYSRLKRMESYRKEYRLKLHDYQNNYFNSLLERTKETKKVDVGEIKKTIGSGELQSNERLLDCLEVLYENSVSFIEEGKKKKKKNHDIEDKAKRWVKLTQSLTERIKFIVFNTNELINVFEIVNNRGKKLSVMAKLKSFFLIDVIRFLDKEDIKRMNNRIKYTWRVVHREFKRLGDMLPDVDCESLFIGVLHQSLYGKDWTSFRDLKTRFNEENGKNKTIRDIEDFLIAMEETIVLIVCAYSPGLFSKVRRRTEEGKRGLFLPLEDKKKENDSELVFVEDEKEELVILFRNLKKFRIGGKITCLRTFLPFLASIFSLDQKNFLKVGKLCEVLFFRTELVSRVKFGSKFRRKFRELASKLRMMNKFETNHYCIDFVLKEILEMRDKDDRHVVDLASNDQIISYFSTLEYCSSERVHSTDFYNNTPFRNYLLLKFEQYLMEERDISKKELIKFEPFDKGYSIEHVFPQGMRSDGAKENGWDWDVCIKDVLKMKEINGKVNTLEKYKTSLKDLDVIVHSIGNLTLTQLNNRLGRKSYEKKRKILQEEDVLLHQSITRNMEWSVEAIIKREAKLGELATKIWDLEAVLSSFKSGKNDVRVLRDKNESIYKHWSRKLEKRLKKQKKVDDNPQLKTVDSKKSILLKLLGNEKIDSKMIERIQNLLKKFQEESEKADEIVMERIEMDSKVENFQECQENMKQLEEEMDEILIHGDNEKMSDVKSHSQRKSWQRKKMSEEDCKNYIRDLIFEKLLLLMSSKLNVKTKANKELRNSIKNEYATKSGLEDYVNKGGFRIIFESMFQIMKKLIELDFKDIDKKEKEKLIKDAIEKMCSKRSRQTQFSQELIENSLEETVEMFQKRLKDEEDRLKEWEKLRGFKKSSKKNVVNKWFIDNSNILKKKGFRFKSGVEIAKEGNCQFEVLADQNDNDKTKHKKLRKKICKWMKNNKDRFKDRFKDNEKAFTNYLDKMKKTGTWGDENTLYAASKYLKKSIEVICSNGIEFKYNQNPPKKGTLYVYYDIRGNHYLSIEKVNKEKDEGENGGDDERSDDDNEDEDENEGNESEDNKGGKKKKKKKKKPKKKGGGEEE